MRDSYIQSLQIQLEEAVQMLRLAAAQKRTCVEIQEWLDINYPDSQDISNQPIVTMLLKSKDEKTK